MAARLAPAALAIWRVEAPSKPSRPNTSSAASTSRARVSAPRSRAARRVGLRGRAAGEGAAFARPPGLTRPRLGPRLCRADLSPAAGAASPLGLSVLDAMHHHSYD